MNSNYAFNNGMTIQIPPFNAANDQLFLAIKNHLDNRFNEMDDKIQEIMLKYNDIENYLIRIQKEVKEMKFKKTCQRNSNNDQNNNSYLHKRKIYKPLKRKMFVPKKNRASLNESDINLNLIKKEFETENETNCNANDGTNSFLSIFNSDTLNINSLCNKESSINNTNEQKYALKINGDIMLKDETLEPVIIYNPSDKREIFIGGNETVRMSLWAYKKCLTCIRGKPSELNSRLCLRLLQAKFGRQYMLNHNYNGSGDKLPIDRVIMQAILTQVKMQFPNQDDIQNNPARFAMFRDYINNAFRVVAYRHRKGILSNTPFWGQNGEPITDLDQPTWIVDHIK